MSYGSSQWPAEQDGRTDLCSIDNAIWSDGADGGHDMEDVRSWDGNKGGGAVKRNACCCQKPYYPKKQRYYCCCCFCRCCYWYS